MKRFSSVSLCDSFMPEKRVICVGMALMDSIFAVPSIPPEPTKVFATAHIEIGGGCAATGAVAVPGLAAKRSCGRGRGRMPWARESSRNWRVGAWKRM